MSPTVLTPAVRPLPPLPLGWLSLLVAAGLVDRTWPNAEGFFHGVVVASSVVSGVALAIWGETQSYVRLARGGALRQLVLTALLPAVAFVAGILATLLLDKGLHAKAVSGGVFLGALWFSSAATGTFIVLVIDAIGRSAASRFATRIRSTVLGLVAVWAGGAALIALSIPRIVSTAFAAAPEDFHLTIGERAMTGPEFQAYLKSDEVPSFLHQLGPADLLSFAVIAVIFVLLLPAVVSAAAKLGELAVERIHPLDQAMERVTSGDLEVRVEEGGAAELERLAARFNQMVEALSLARRMEHAFGAYVSRPVLDRIRAQHGALELPSIQREATVFFADVRGFTPMSERLSPGQILDILKRYYAEVLEIVAEHEGYVDKFIGDAIYVVYNGPIEQPDHVARAAETALALMAHVERMNARGAFPEIGRLDIGIGVATGPVIAGNLGTSRSMQFSVLGDTVNLAARLSGHAPAGEVWCNAATASALPETLEAVPLEPIVVKGKQQPVQPHRLRAR